MKAGWVIRAIGDVCEIFDRKRKPISKRDREPGPYPYYGASCIQDYVSGYLFDGRYLLIGEDGAKWGPGEDTAYIAEGKFWVNNHAHIVKAREGYLDDYLRYFIKHLDLNPIVAGAIIPKLTQEKLATLEVPFPSFPEQQRIVAILDQEFAKIDALKANAEKSFQAAKDLLQATLKKELEPREGWEVAEINSVCLKTDNIKWKDIPEEKEYTYIDLTSVDRSTKSVVEPQRIRKSNAPSRAQRLVFRDDIIFATTRPTLRRYCIIPEQYDEHICSTGFCVLRPDKRKVRPSWLFHCLSADTFYDYVEPLQTGATYPAISDKDVKGYAISLPPIAEQDHIISRLDDFNNICMALQDNYQKILSLCDDLKQSFLRKAFNGEL